MGKSFEDMPPARLSRLLRERSKELAALKTKVKQQKDYAANWRKRYFMSQNPETKNAAAEYNTPNAFMVHTIVGNRVILKPCTILDHEEEETVIYIPSGRTNGKALQAPITLFYSQDDVTNSGGRARLVHKLIEGAQPLTPAEIDKLIMFEDVKTLQSAK